MKLKTNFSLIDEAIDNITFQNTNALINYVTQAISRELTKIIEAKKLMDEDIRMITIAPDYSNKIIKSLKSLGYVEIKTYEFDNNDKLLVNDYVE